MTVCKVFGQYQCFEKHTISETGTSPGTFDIPKQWYCFARRWRITSKRQPSPQSHWRNNRFPSYTFGENTAKPATEDKIKCWRFTSSFALWEQVRKLFLSHFFCWLFFCAIAINSWDARSVFRSGRAASNCSLVDALCWRGWERISYCGSAFAPRNYSLSWDVETKFRYWKSWPVVPVQWH